MNSMRNRKRRYHHRFITLYDPVPYQSHLLAAPHKVSFHTPRPYEFRQIRICMRDLFLRR